MLKNYDEWHWRGNEMDDENIIYGIVMYSLLNIEYTKLYYAYR